MNLRPPVEDTRENDLRDVYEAAHAVARRAQKASRRQGILGARKDSRQFAGGSADAVADGAPDGRPEADGPSTPPPRALVLSHCSGLPA